MSFKKTDGGKTLIVELVGEVDSMNVVKIEEDLLKELDGVTDITFDMKKLEYISSAGLRVLLQTQKVMKTKGGTMVITNVNDEVMDIFKVTGFVRLLNIVPSR